MYFEICEGNIFPEAMPEATLTFRVGDYVWILPEGKEEFYLPWAGKIIAQADNKTKVENDSGEESWVDSSSILGEVHADIRDSTDDMISLNDLQERTLLRNIHIRYLKDHIYTYIGWILIAVNPYKQLPIYSKKDVDIYSEKRIGELSPHIYAIGAQAYSNINTHFQGQCIIISGESGAGKTESTKLLINYLASLNEKTSVCERIIAANPILEAFGNAKTTKNDNSSRFGKYVEIYFESGRVEGASINHYLLEKARIKSQNMGERNYHIFYSMLEGLSQQEKKQLKLETSHYYYLKNVGPVIKCEGRNEALEFEKVKKGLSTLNFSSEDIWAIFKLLAAILHIGNLTYNSVTVNNIEASEIIACEHLDVTVSLLKVVEKDFLEALTQKTMFIGGNKVVSSVSKDQACVYRDGFSMALYSRLFSFILKHINKLISNQIIPRKPSIGILDIFGFENFASNSFEQLCINFANEHLQQFFVHHIFKLEQSEYMKEGIKWQNLEFIDNEAVLGLIGGGHINIMTLLDEQTKFPQGDDKGLVVKMNQHFCKHESFLSSKFETKLEFGVRHYAGTVTYKVDGSPSHSLKMIQKYRNAYELFSMQEERTDIGFIEKNRNSLSADWLNVIKTCGNAFLKDLFTKELSTTTKGCKTSLVIQYKLSLEMLMSTLNSCDPFFIRCIKPNNVKKPLIFNHSLCSQQLQYLGIMDTAKIRRAGYPLRYSYFEFIQRYRILIPGTPPAHKVHDHKALAQIICQTVLADNQLGAYQLGITKIFLKSHHSNKLEVEREKLFTKLAIIFQKNVRAFLCRTRFKRMLYAAKIIQRYWRAYNPRRNFIIIRRGFLRLQACIRSRQLTHKLKNRRKVKIDPIINPVEKSSEATDPEMVPGPTSDHAISIIENLFEDFSPPDDKNVEELPLQSSANVLISQNSTTFSQFAAANFMGNVGSKFCSKTLPMPLLCLPTYIEQMAAPALWITIQRFMGYFPEPESKDKKSNHKELMQLLNSTISRNSSLSKEWQNTINLLEKEDKERIKRCSVEGPTILINASIAHKNKLKAEMDRLKLKGESLKKSYDEWLWTKKSLPLEKLYFIIGHGILCPELRDEIYCQICKQLTENPNKDSEKNGWYLMYFCCASFPPSDKFCPVLFNFIESHRKSGKLQESCLTILQRTLQNGTRNQPPSRFELNALNQRLPLKITIDLPAGKSFQVEIDASTTANEICSQIFKHIGLKDSFGFSLFISVFGSVISLEDGSCHVMDAISQCEQHAKEKGIPEGKAPWKFIIRKEMFAPWEDFSHEGDDEASNQIYFQIIKGVKSGKYKCTEAELALLLAQYYYVLYGKKMLNELLTDIIGEFIPVALSNKEDFAYWSQLIHDCFTKSYFIKCSYTYEMVKRDIIQFAKQKWPLYFSKYYEVKQISGIKIEEKLLLLAVNSKGIFFARNNTEVIMKLPYLEIAHIEQGQSRACGTPTVQIITIQNYKFSFQTNYAEVITNLVNWVVQELKKRSKFVVAVSDYNAPDDSFLSLRQGDLITLFGDRNTNFEWLTGIKQKTGDIGDFPHKCIQVLPATSPPPKYILDWYVQSHSYSGVKNTNGSFLDLKKHTLENYATKYFSEKSSSIWRHTKSPITTSLHYKLSLGPQKSNAVAMFLSVLNYTGDKKISIQKLLTKPVFEQPLQNENLRDELYCQLMKQVTDNNNKESEKRGWELLWLAAGLFPCSKNLIQDLRLFLQTRPNRICQETYDRFEKTLDHGTRKHLHHWLEVKAVQESVPILHNIVFPNQMEKLFEVESSTKVGELVENITDWLSLSNKLGFCLVVSIENKTVSLCKDDFLFDAIQDAWIKCCPEIYQKHTQETQKVTYELIFMKKLWINTIPGQDPKADTICHYHQELIKYLSGCHPCTNTDIVHLSSLILLSETDNIKTNLEQRIGNRLNTLIPVTALECKQGFDWITLITESYNKNAGMSSEKAQISFLKYIEKWPTFGTAFFDVESVPYLTDKSSRKLILGINRNGILIMDNETEEIIMTVNYKEMQSCSYSGTTFSVLFDSGKYSWYTNFGFKLADLVDSYLQVSNDFMYYYR